MSSDAVNNDGETYEVYQEQRPFVNHFSIADRDDFGTKVKCRSMEDGHFEEVPLDQIAMQNDFILPIIRIRGVDFNGKKTGESIHIVLTEDNGSIEPIEFSSDTTIVSIKNVDKNSDGFQIVFDEESGMFTEVL